MPSFFIAFYQLVCLAMVFGNQTGVFGVLAFPVTVGVLLLFLKFYMYILHVDCGGVPYIRGQRLALAYHLKKMAK